jgi:iron complex transport system ATP-binding protein
MRLHQLSFAYPGGPNVVDGVSGDILAGQLHALVGPNAAGKSTLLRLMLGQISPGKGRVELAGRRVGFIRPRKRAAIMSYVPQRSTVGFGFTVRQVIAMGRFALPDDPMAVDQAVESCDLRDVVDRPFNALSVGQQQRVLLARALAQSRGSGKVMLLDEPTSAMDLAHMHAVMGLLRGLADDEGLAVVVIMHDLNLAARYADSAWLLNRGALVASGHWSDVLTPEVLEPVYHVKLDALPRQVDPGDPLARRPVLDARLPGEFD